MEPEWGFGDGELNAEHREVGADWIHITHHCRLKSAVWRGETNEHRVATRAVDGIREVSSSQHDIATERERASPDLGFDFESDALSAPRKDGQGDGVIRVRGT